MPRAFRAMRSMPMSRRGVASDHECTGFGEALDKLRRGQWIMIREGTAAHNLAALLPLF